MKLQSIVENRKTPKDLLLSIWGKLPTTSHQFSDTYLFSFTFTTSETRGISQSIAYCSLLTVFATLLMVSETAVHLIIAAFQVMLPELGLLI